MSNMGGNQNKESPGTIIWEHFTTVSPEKHDSSIEEGLSSLLESEWAVAESQRGMMQDKIKFVWQGATRWKTGVFLGGRIELFNEA